MSILMCGNNANTIKKNFTFNTVYYRWNQMLLSINNTLIQVSWCKENPSCFAQTSAISVLIISVLMLFSEMHVCISLLSLVNSTGPIILWWKCCWRRGWWRRLGCPSVAPQSAQITMWSYWLLWCLFCSFNEKDNWLANSTFVEQKAEHSVKDLNQPTQFSSIQQKEMSTKKLLGQCLQMV